jgi:hypothetical protein
VRRPIRWAMAGLHLSGTPWKSCKGRPGRREEGKKRGPVRQELGPRVSPPSGSPEPMSAFPSEPLFVPSGGKSCAGSTRRIRPGRRKVVLPVVQPAPVRGEGQGSALSVGPGGGETRAPCPGSEKALPRPAGEGVGAGEGSPGARDNPGKLSHFRTAASHSRTPRPDPTASRAPPKKCRTRARSYAPVPFLERGRSEEERHTRRPLAPAQPAGAGPGTGPALSEAGVCGGAPPRGGGAALRPVIAPSPAGPAPTSLHPAALAGLAAPSPERRGGAACAPQQGSWTGE